MGCLLDNANLITKVVFPVELLPVGAVLSAFIINGIGFVLFLVYLAIMGYLHLTWLFLPVVMVAEFVFTWGIASFLAAAAVFIRDIRELLGIVLMVLFFSVPIIYPPSMVPENWSWLLHVNPMAIFVSVIRDVLLRHHVDPGTMIAVVALAGCLLRPGVMVFHAGQIRFRGCSVKMFHVIVEELGKDYRIYARPVDRLLEAILRKPRHRALRAVQGVSFNLLRGQSLGIIGDNGAGKSTLLKLLVGTVSPTAGRMEMSGRVTALLELGAGFHPEFSGRQNIFMNASLFGLSPEEIGEKEEAIIAFSGLGEFIDRPVKTYSSGMYVRLGFAIATSVDPDILIIDEALAVGDMAFQRKCIDRMNLFREQGKTMIFCSHSMYHVKELCDKTLWLDHGRMKGMGPTMEVVAQYEDFCRGKEVAAASDGKAGSGDSFRRVPYPEHLPRVGGRRSGCSPSSRLAKW